jgi:LasA protease
MMRNACTALIAIGSWVVCCSPLANAAPPTPTPTPTINDHYFSWDTREFSVDDAAALIDAHPKLAPHRVRIIDRLGYHSINPRLLPVLADLGDVLASTAGAEVLTAQRIDAFVAGLAQMYHLGRSTKFAPKSLAAASVMTMNESDAGLRAIAETFVRGESRFEQFVEAYTTRFGVRNSLSINATGTIGETAAPANFLRLPWIVGQTGWSFNGVHSNTGGCPAAACTAPRSAIDFSRGWPVWGTSTTNAPVLAAHAGTVSVFSSCNVRVTNANGWATNYYHLANVVVTSGQSVVVGQPIANYSDNETQALCDGGSSTGPHVHLVLLQNGSQVPIDQSEFSGWRVNATGVIEDYDSTCSRMWFSSIGSTNACSYQGASPSAWAMHTLPATMPSSKLCDLDVDGSGQPTADRDGVLLSRYFSGFRGAALMDGVAQSGATRITASQIETFLASKNYDLNLDGGVQSSRDGLIAVRDMSGTVASLVAAGTGPFTGLLSSSSGVAAYVFGCR